MFIVLASCFVALQTVPTVQGNFAVVSEPEVRRALVISAECFLDKNIPNLSVKNNTGVETLCERLRDPRLEFEAENIFVLANENATLENINKALDELLNSCGSDDIVLIYFTGHGLRNPETNVDYYLPYDAKLIVEDEGVVAVDGSTCFSFDALQMKLNACDAKFKLVISDVSRNNFDVRNTDDSRVSEKNVEESKGVLWFKGCKSGRTSFNVITAIDDQPVSGSLFTWYVCKGLEGEAADNQGRISVLGLVRYVNDKIKDPKVKYSQTPVFSCQEFADGDFILGAGFKKKEKNARTLYVEALEFFSKGNNKQARTKIDEALKLDPQNDKYQKLKKAIREATIQEHISQALKYYIERQYSDALIEVDVALAFDPLNQEALKFRKIIESLQREDSAEVEKR